MAYSNIDVGWIEYPWLTTYHHVGWAGTYPTLDASGEFISWCGPVSEAGTITDVVITINSTTVAGDLDIRIETVDSGGLPSGTLWDTNTEGTISLLTSDDFVVKTCTLTAGAVVSANDFIAVKIRANASSTPTVQLVCTQQQQTGMPYRCYDLGTPTKDIYPPMIHLQFSDGSLMRQQFGLETIADANYDFFDNTNVLGIKFQLPFDATIKGFWFTADINADATCRLYAPDGSTILRSQDVYYGVVRSAGDPYPRHMIFNSDVNLKARTWYRIGLISGSATSSTIYTPGILTETNFGTGWFMDQAEELSNMIQHTESDDDTPSGEGSWTDTPTKICTIGVIITNISEYAEEVGPTYFFVPQQIFV
jgi:hypothetical protein